MAATPIRSAATKSMHVMPILPFLTHDYGRFRLRLDPAIAGIDGAPNVLEGGVAVLEYTAVPLLTGLVHGPAVTITPSRSEVCVHLLLWPMYDINVMQQVVSYQSRAPVVLVKPGEPLKA